MLWGRRGVYSTASSNGFKLHCWCCAHPRRGKTLSDDLLVKGYEYVSIYESEQAEARTTTFAGHSMSGLRRRVPGLSHKTTLDVPHPGSRSPVRSQPLRRSLSESSPRDRRTPSPSLPRPASSTVQCELPTSIIEDHMEAATSRPTQSQRLKRLKTVQQLTERCTPALKAH